MDAKLVTTVQVPTAKICTLCGVELNSRTKFKTFKHLNGHTTYACSKCTWEGAAHWKRTMDAIDGVFTELGKLRSVPMGDLDKLLDVWENIDRTKWDDVADCMVSFEDGDYDR